MLDIFKGREEIANATNKLFETGFYLLNLGFALMILEMNMYDDTYQVLIEKLSYKIGGFSIYLGLMLFLNLYFFFRGKRKASQAQVEQRMVINGKIHNPDRFLKRVRIFLYLIPCKINPLYTLKIISNGANGYMITILNIQQYI